MLGFLQFRVDAEAQLNLLMPCNVPNIGLPLRKIRWGITVLVRFCFKDSAKYPVPVVLSLMTESAEVVAEISIDEVVG